MSDIGHNNPPASERLDVDLIIDQIEIEHVDIFVRHAELTSGFRSFMLKYEKSGINDIATAGNAADFIKQLKLEANRVNELRESIKRPYLDIGKKIDSLFKHRIVDFQKNAAKEIETILSVYQDRVANEIKAKAIQEAAQRREEIARLLDAGELEEAVEVADLAAAADRVVKADIKDLSRIRGDRGSLATTKLVKDFDVEDLDLVPREYLMLDERAVYNAIDAGVNRIPGIKIKETLKTTVR